MTVDMGSEKSIRSLVKTIAERFGVIDILVNNAGITHSALPKDTATKDFDRCMQVTWSARAGSIRVWQETSGWTLTKTN